MNASEPYRIFLIEDDSAITESLTGHLTSWGYTVRAAADLRHVLGEFVSFDPHLVLVDIMLPFFNGYHWCGEIRKISRVPVVFLSSASDNMNIVMAMNQGGDDFIPKPVDPMVLTAKIQAILRRAYDLSGRVSVLTHGGAELTLSDGTLTANGRRLELTKNEFRILQTLMENHGHIISRDRLMNALWQNDCYVEENTLTVNVTRLRKKLETAGLAGFIVTKPGSGYIVP